MPPEKLLAWERVLQSPVAVLLLMIASHVIWWGVVKVLWRRNQEQNEKIIELLSSQADFSTAVAHVDRLVTLTRTLTDARPAVEASPHD